MLNFKYGKFNGLFNTDGTNKLGLKEGTVYITTDEKAMYVDLNTGSAVERIRLSQIVNIPTIAEWNALKPPFSKEAFYYVVEANALLKYTGTGDDQGWQQINSTSDLERELGDLETALGNLSQTVTNNATTMNSHITNTDNPHKVTKAQVGLGNVEDKSAATLKSEFTAKNGVSASETGFTTGAQVHTAVQGVNETLQSHIIDTDNPHGVTKAQVGLGNVEDKSTATIKSEFAKNNDIAANKSGFTTGQVVYAYIEALKNGYTGTLKDLNDAISDGSTALNAHKTDDTNPHKVTKKQVGLEYVDNTSDADKPVSTAQKKYIDDTAADLLGDANDAAGENTIHGANKAADAAQEYAEGVQTNLTAHTTDQNNPHKVTAKQLHLEDFENKTVAGIKESFAAKAIADNDAGFASGDQVYDYIQNLRGSYTGTLEGLNTSIGNVSTALNSHTTNEDNPHKVTAAQLGVGDFKGYTRATLKDEWKATSIANDVAGFTTGDQVYDYIVALKNGYTGTLDDLDDDISQNATDIANLGTTVSNLDTRLTSALQTADALKYIGTVAAFSGLPTTGSNPAPAIGWTYKATAKFALTAAQSATGKAVEVYIGDLLIATGTESGGVITSNLKWDHIPSGYVADYNPKFSLSEANNTGVDGVDSDSKVVLNLTSGASSTAGDLGKINFQASTDSAIRLTASNTNSGAATLQLSLAWGTF
jgi:hypothetical protein